MRKKAVQQGRSERRGESYSGLYGEPLSDVRTPLAVFFRILLKVQVQTNGHHVPVLLELFITQGGVLRVDFLEPDMAIGAIEGEMFAEKELQASPHMSAKPMLRLVEVAGAFDMGEVPAGPSENKWGNPFCAEWIDQQGPLNRKGSDGCRIDVGLAIVDGAFNGKKFEWVETELSAAKPVRVSLFRVKVGRTTANRKQSNIHIIEEPFCCCRFGPFSVQHSA